MDVRVAFNLLLAAPEFDALERRLRDLSVFHVLGIDRREVSHSALLAWLLDPRASHGGGADPLRSFMLLGAREASAPGMLDVLDVDGLDLESVSAVAEHAIQVDGTSRRLDVVVLDAADRPLLVVEYKVDAAEGVGQTSDYVAWARERPLSLPGDRAVMPLLVFVCPERDAAQAPAQPFVHLRYEPYLDWLGQVQERVDSPRAKFLVAEFRACLAQRSDVRDQELEDLAEQLGERQGEAIEAIREAPHADLAAFEAVLLRHREALAQLDISSGRRNSLGGSAFVGALREALEARLSPELWSLGKGRGSITATFEPARERARRHGDATVRLLIRADRPRSGRAWLYLVVATKTELPGLDAEANKALRYRIAEALRQHLAPTHGSDLQRGHKVVAFKVDLPGVDDLADDVPERIERFQDQIRLAAARMAAAEAPLAAWTGSELPKLLEYPG